MGSVQSALSELRSEGVNVKDSGTLNDLADLDYLLVDLQPWVIHGEMKVTSMLLDGQVSDVLSVFPEEQEYSNAIDRLIAGAVVCSDAKWVEETRQSTEFISSHFLRDGSVTFDVKWKSSGPPMDCAALGWAENYREVDMIREQWREVSRVYLPFEDVQYRVCVSTGTTREVRAFITGALVPLLKRCDGAVFQNRLSMLDALKREYLIGRGTKMEFEQGQLVRGYGELDLSFLPANYAYSADQVNFPLGLETDELSLMTLAPDALDLVQKKFVFIGFLGFCQTYYEPSLSLSALEEMRHPPQVVLISPSSAPFVNHFAKRLGVIKGMTHLEARRHNEKNQLSKDSEGYVDSATIASLIYEMPTEMDASYYSSIFGYKELALAGVTAAHKGDMIEFLQRYEKKVGVMCCYQREIMLAGMSPYTFTPESSPEVLRTSCKIEVSEIEVGQVVKALVGADRYKYGVAA